MNRRLFYWPGLWLLPVAISHAGVVIGGTRFIYHAERTTLSVPLRNTSDSDWLVDSHVLSGGRWPGADDLSPRKPPFVVTPPLFLLRAGEENTLRVAWSGEALARDRESLFTLSIAAIPSGKTGANSVQMAFRSALKLIYRPVGLIGDPQQAYRHLVWNLTADGLTVRNPDPITSPSFQSASTVRRSTLPVWSRRFLPAAQTGVDKRRAAPCGGKASTMPGA